MLRKDIKTRIARDMRGKITTGNRGKEANDHPRSLHYFNLSEFPEFQAIYGKEPEKIIVVFPTDNIEDFYSTEYSQWGTGKGGMKIKKRSCDGETCLDCITREEKPCYCRELPADEQCKCYMSLKAFIVNPNTGVIVNFAPTLFESHSINTADAIYSELEKVWIMTGGKLRGIPFVISVDMIEKLNEKGQKTKFPLWKIQVAGTINTALNYAKIAALPTTEQNRLAIDATCQVDAVAALPEAKETQAKDARKVSQAQLKRLFAIVSGNGYTNDQAKEIIRQYGYESSKDIIVGDYDKIVREFEKQGITEPPDDLFPETAGSRHPATAKT